jgi:hypothetical protein
MKYYAASVGRLKEEARARFERLMAALTCGSSFMFRGHEVTNVNGTDVRLAVDDFKTILAEIRKLK